MGWVLLKSPASSRRKSASRSLIMRSSALRRSSPEGSDWPMRVGPLITSAPAVAGSGWGAKTARGASAGEVQLPGCGRGGQRDTSSRSNCQDSPINQFSAAGSSARMRFSTCSCRATVHCIRRASQCCTTRRTCTPVSRPGAEVVRGSARTQAAGMPLCSRVSRTETRTSSLRTVCGDEGPRVEGPPACAPAGPGRDEAGLAGLPSRRSMNPMRTLQGERRP